MIAAVRVSSDLLWMFQEGDRDYNRKVDGSNPLKSICKKSIQICSKSENFDISAHEKF